MPRPKIYDDDLRRRLVARAATMLAELGPSGLALRQVAAAEGTSTTAIYSMFEDRAGLMREVGVTASRSFIEAQRAVPVTDDPFADLFSLGRAYRQWALENPTLYFVLMAPPAEDMRMSGPLPQAEAAGALRDVILRLIEAELFPALNPDLILGLIWASVHGFVALELAGYYRPTPREQLDRMYQAQLDAIARGWLKRS
ncbi:MAG: WHG domain-containing protein [Actinobacteria bacterium]|nr:WHG domain-containing protein [Actinomycetota bacterium]